MAFFNLGKKNTYVNLNDYKNLDSVSKSFTKGKASSKVSFINVPGYEETQDDKNNREPVDYYIRRKQTFYNYAKGNLVAQSIIRTRISQIRKFAFPSRQTPDGVGFHIVPKDHKAKLTNKEKQRVKELEDFIYHTGKDYKDYRDDFQAFLTKFVFDYFVYDQINIERLYESARSKKLNHFNMVDAGTIVIKENPKHIDEPRKFSQIIDGKEAHIFDERHLTFSTYWDSGNVSTGGYGCSPVEASLNHLGYFNDTELFNATFFKQGGTTRGLLVINSGDQYSQVALDSLQRSWSNLAGINGAWKIPVMTAASAQFVNMTQSSKDMEFSEWLNYLINILSGIFQINPEEINFPNKGGATGKSSGATFEGKGATQDRNQASKEKGLTPLLRFIESVINDKILAYVDPDYRFEFTLGDTGEEQKRQTLINAKLKNGMTLNEARQANGLEKLDGLDVPGDANNWIQYKSIQSKTDPDSAYTEQHKTDYEPDKQAPEPNKQEPDPDNKVNQ